MAKRFQPPPGRAKWGHGTITPHGKQYLWVRSKNFRLEDGTTKRRRIVVGTFATREEAEAARLEAAPLTAAQIERLTWDKWLTRWLASYTLFLESEERRSYAASLRRSVELHLKPRIGRLLLTETTPDHITQLWLDLLNTNDGDLAHKTVKNIRGALSLATREAMAKGLIASDVVHLSRMPRGGTDHEDESEDEGEGMRVLDPADAAALGVLCLEGGLGVWSLPTLIALDTGCRRGEALGLQWRDVDLDNGLVRFRRQMLEHSGEPGRRLADLKTKRSKRTVSLPNRTAEALRRLQAEKRRSGKSLLFVDDEGESLSPDAWSQTWRRKLSKDHPFLAGSTPHDLRHSHASLLLRAGTSVLVVSARLGHRSPSFTLDTYSHAIPEDLSAVAATWSLIMTGEVAAPAVFKGTGL